MDFKSFLEEKIGYTLGNIVYYGVPIVLPFSLLLLGVDIRGVLLVSLLCITDFRFVSCILFSFGFIVALEQPAELSSVVFYIAYALCLAYWILFAVFGLRSGSWHFLSLSDKKYIFWVCLCVIYLLSCFLLASIEDSAPVFLVNILWIIIIGFPVCLIVYGVVRFIRSLL